MEKERKRKRRRRGNANYLYKRRNEGERGQEENRIEEERRGVKRKERR